MTVKTWLQSNFLPGPSAKKVQNKKMNTSRLQQCAKGLAEKVRFEAGLE